MGEKTYSEARTERNEAILKDMQEHLFQRYGEIEYSINYFTPRELTNPSKDTGYMYISHGDNESEREQFVVERHGNIDEGYYYEDNYYWYIIRDEYEKEIKTKLSSLFPECKVFLCANRDANVLPDEINGQTTLAEAKEIGLPNHMFWIIVDPLSIIKDDFESLESEVKSRWPFDKTNTLLRIFLPDSPETYEAINRYNDTDYLKNYVAEINN